MVVNVDATEKKVLEKNRKRQSQVTDETDREGGKRKVEDQSTDEQLVIIQNGEKEVPIVIETKKPAIRGVLVVAKGADNIQVKKWIIEAVTRVSRCSKSSSFGFAEKNEGGFLDVIKKTNSLVINDVKFSGRFICLLYYFTGAATK